MVLRQHQEIGDGWSTGGKRGMMEDEARDGQQQGFESPDKPR